MNRKTRKIRHIITGVLTFAIIAGGTAWYGISHLYASQEEKTLKLIQQSGKTLEGIMENYISKISTLDPMGNHTYEGNITVSECTYDGVDYRPDVNNKSQKYSIVTTNNNIVLDMPHIKDATLVVDKNDILKYGLAKIDSSQTEPILRAVLSHIMQGYEAAVKENINNINVVNKGQNEVYSVVISDEALISGFNTIVEEMYKDSVVLPYISLLNVNGITEDKIKNTFSQYADGVYTTVNMNVDSEERLTGIELVMGDINISLTGEDNPYDSMQLVVTTPVINGNYINASVQLDMQDMNNIKYGIDADVSYRSHSLKLRAEGDIKKK